MIMQVSVVLKYYDQYTLVGNNMSTFYFYNTFLSHDNYVGSYVVIFENVLLLQSGNVECVSVCVCVCL